MEQPVADVVVDAIIEALGSLGSGSGAVATYLDEDTLLHLPGGSGLAGDYRGREAVCGVLERMAAASHGTLRFEMAHTTATGEAGVRLHGDVCGQRLGRSLATTATLEATLVGSTIREVWLSCADQPAWDDFWA